MSGNEGKSNKSERSEKSEKSDKSTRKRQSNDEDKRDRTYDKERRRSPSYEERKDRKTERKNDRYDRDSDSRRRRSRSPRDNRHSRRNDRRGDKPIIPNRPKLFQKPSDPSTSNPDPNAWSTRIAAVASDDGQRSKFEKLLGMHKKPSEADSSKPVLASVDESTVKSMKKELSKMENDLDRQYEQSRAFTHTFRRQGL